MDDVAEPQLCILSNRAIAASFCHVADGGSEPNTPVHRLQQDFLQARLQHPMSVHAECSTLHLGITALQAPPAM
jgi:hypothetical protein